MLEPSNIGIHPMVDHARRGHVLQIDASVGAWAIEVVGEGFAVIDEFHALTPLDIERTCVRGELDDAAGLGIGNRGAIERFGYGGLSACGSSKAGNGEKG